LYDEDDYQARPAYTDPEILRTNLAAVILQMSVLGLGEVADFPFIDPPDSRLISDGYQLLYELQAVDERRRVTALGRQLARLPIDPRLGRMILAAQRQGCLREVLIIASALAIQDPRERPLEHRQAADERHRRLHNERSDFLSLLKLWEFYHEQARKLSKSKLRALCQQEFLSFVRMREWHDLHQELHGLVTEMGLRPNESPADYGALHRALLSGLLGNLGNRQEDRTWLGARGRRFFIFPGSGLFKQGPRWLMAAELVETSKVYARTVAKIEPEWIESLARHLVKRSYADPHWEKRAAQVAATERVTLYGLTIVAGRKINYGPIDPVESRTLFIRHALVRQEYHCSAPFFRRQRELIAEIEQLEAKTRRRDLLVDEDTLFRFYDERLPPGIYSGPGFEQWRKQAERENPELLFLTREILLNQDTAPDTGEQFPDRLDLDGLQLPLSYRFMPGAEDDGVTLTTPLAALNQLDARRLEWLVPGLLGQRMVALLKALPKALRRHFVPVPNYVQVLREVLVADGSRLTDAMTARLHQITGVAIPPDAWQPDAVPDHLRMRLRVLDADGSVLVQGRDLEAIKKSLEQQARHSFAALPTPEFERDDVRDWDFGELPQQVEFERNGIRLKGYPTLQVQADGRLALRLVDAPERAERLLKDGVRRLLVGRLRDQVRHLKRNLPGLQAMSLYYVGVGTQENLRDDLLTAILDRAFLDNGPLPRHREAFEACLSQGRARLYSVANELCAIVQETLAAYHEVRKTLSGAMPLGWSESLEDIREQLDGLVYQGFVAHTPAVWLGHLPRYLRAVAARLRKIKQAPDKDQQRRTEISGLRRRCQAQERKNAAAGVTDPALEQFRWMLEEYRVSVFAQELKTALPVSLKRLEEQWSRVRT
jgi:ATP-dependent helicase HrpA